MFSPVETFAQYGVYDILFSAADAEATALIDPGRARQNAAQAASMKRSYRNIRAFQRQHMREGYQDNLEQVLRRLQATKEQLHRIESQGNKSATAHEKQAYDAEFHDAQSAVALGKHYAPMGQPFTTEAHGLARSLGLA